MKKTGILIGLLILSSAIFGQKFEQNLSDTTVNKVKGNVGADFALQFQGLSHSADSALIPLGSNFNLPTANLNVSAMLGRGMKVYLRTYLSSRHHPESWVKGGYLLMDEMPFLNSKPMDNIMDHLTLKVGVMETNFGDAHFFRSDNGDVISNNFVGNYIMDAFTTAPGLEILYRQDGWLAMGAISSGSLRPDLTGYSSYSGDYTEYNLTDELAFYWKGGYDKQFNDDLRFRATLSGYHQSNHHFGSLYYGERAGSRYYMVMNEQTENGNVDPSSPHTTGRWGPGFSDQLNSLMQNIFIQYNGLEVFTTYEMADGTGAFSGQEFKFTQYAAEALYHFGGNNQFYFGGRYNYVENDSGQSVDRYQLIGGWDMTDNIKTKLEYVNQNYEEFTSQYGEDAGFNGMMLEAAISF
ncbi:MAG: hypothetical protein K9H65_00145 [Bacteroidales bacterium]|nr:hypothetical protein [Bacteroidales bacterium]